MRRGYRLFILMSFFIGLFVFSAPKPAQAQMSVVDYPAIAKFVEYITTFKNYVTGLFDLINKQIGSVLGSDDLAPETCESTLAAVKSGNIPKMTTKGGLIPYLKDCGYPQIEELIKKATAENSQMQAMAAAYQGRLLDSQAQVQFKRDADKRALDNVLSVTGAPETLCGPASIIRSNSAAEIAVEQLRDQAMRVAMAETSGDKAKPEFAKGPTQNANALIAERIKMKVCKNTGQDDVDKFWCKDAPLREELENRDLSAEVFTPRLLQEDNETMPNYYKYAQMYIKAVFMDRAFTPIPAASVDGGLTGQTAELLARRFNYTALMSTFQQPYIQAAMERKPLENMAAFDSLRAVLVRGGWGDLMGQFIGQSGGISRESMRYIQYKAFYEDPQRIVTDLAQAVPNKNAVLAFNAMTSMNIVTLLWDNLKEQERTNRLLGGLGALLAKDYYDDIDGRIRAISGSPNS